jgi:nicotinate-nucleotide pyrophosphorylase (carboxylating)
MIAQEGTTRSSPQSAGTSSVLEAAAPLIRAALAEDIGDGDRTGHWTVPEGATGRARIVARGAGIVCGTTVAGRVFESVDEGSRVRVSARDGTAVSPEDVILEVAGPLRAILAAERTALNFLCRLSGIATLTSRYVAAVEGTRCRIADTRKTTPGWRKLEKYAVRTGGGTNHREGLHDMVLIKENHIRAAGGVREALDAALPPARRANLEVEIEVTTEDELREALASAPDRVMLDNMAVSELATAVGLVRGSPPPRPLLEASGRVTLDTARQIAGTGVDYISVGALTHSAPALDLSLLVTAR